MIATWARAAGPIAHPPKTEGDVNRRPPMPAPVMGRTRPKAGLSVYSKRLCSGTRGPDKPLDFLQHPAWLHGLRHVTLESKLARAITVFAVRVRRQRDQDHPAQPVIRHDF